MDFCRFIRSGQTIYEASSYVWVGWTFLSPKPSTTFVKRVSMLKETKRLVAPFWYGGNLYRTQILVLYRIYNIERNQSHGHDGHRTRRTFHRQIPFP
jgi:hypothetical protein